MSINDIINNEDDFSVFGYDKWYASCYIVKTELLRCTRLNSKFSIKIEFDARLV